ncbi:hypothetical protein [Mycobacteroides abscessus]
MIGLDKELGIRSDLDTKVTERLKARRSNDRDVEQEFRKRLLTLGSSIAFSGIPIIAMLILMASVFDFSQQQGMSDFQKIRRSWRLLDGIIEPSLALTVNLALLALVASINISLAASNRANDHRSEALSRIWSVTLKVASYVSTIISLAFAIMQSSSIHHKPDFGVGAAAILAAILVSLLTVSIAQHANASDRALSYDVAIKTRTDIDSWVSIIRQYHAPVRFPITGSMAAQWRRWLPRTCWSVSFISALSLAYTFAAMFMLNLTLNHKFGLRFSTSDIVFSVSYFSYTALIILVIGIFTTSRWSTKKKSPLWSLRIAPILGGCVYLLLISLLLLALGAAKNDDMGQALETFPVVAGPFIVAPLLTWAAIRLSRSNPDRLVSSKWYHRAHFFTVRLSAWLSGPIWHTVSSLIEGQYRRQTAQMLRAHDDEARETSTNASPIELSFK